jgi:hypothetical protein
MRWWFGLLLFVVSTSVAPCVAAPGTAERAAANEILETGTAKDILGDISRLGHAQRVVATPQVWQAELDFRVGAMKWAMAHPNASPVEREQFLAVFGAKILAGLMHHKDYMRPPEAVEVNEVVLPYYSAPQPQVMAPKKPSAPEPDMDALIDSITIDDIRRLEQEQQHQATPQGSQSQAK